MASTKEYLDFVLEQLSELDEVSSQAMMREYITNEQMNDKKFLKLVNG